MKTFWSVLISLCFISVPVLSAEPQAKLKVIASNSLIADWTLQVAGDKVDLKVLVGADSDVHNYEPTPADTIAVAQADVVFENGLGFEHWMNKLYRSSGSSARRVILTQGVVKDPLMINEDAHHHEADGHHHGERDPHVWHNVRYVIGMVAKIADELGQADVHNRDLYQQRAADYIVQLQELDGWILKQTSRLSKEERRIVTNHDSLGYFCERYQFTLVGAVFESSTTEAEDPSARDMAELIMKIKKTGVRAVFAENVSNAKVIAALAQEAKVRLAPALYTDALGAPGSEADTYIKMIRYNVKTLVEALTPKDT